MSTVDTPKPNMAGGWSGACPVPGCGTILQGADQSVVGLHLSVVHPDWNWPTPGQVTVTPKARRGAGRE